VGRFPRSVEMMTQRPVMGSLRNSGKASLLERANVDETGAFERLLDTALYRVFAAWRTLPRLTGNHRG